MASDDYNQLLPTNEDGDSALFELWRLRSVYPPLRGQSTYWHLHPEFVERCTPVHAESGEESRADETEISPSDFQVSPLYFLPAVRTCN